MLEEVFFFSYWLKVCYTASYVVEMLSEVLHIIWVASTIAHVNILIWKILNSCNASFLYLFIVSVVLLDTRSHSLIVVSLETLATRWPCGSNLHRVIVDLWWPVSRERPTNHPSSLGWPVAIANTVYSVWNQQGRFSLLNHRFTFKVKDPLSCVCVCEVDGILLVWGGHHQLPIARSAAGGHKASMRCCPLQHTHTHTAGQDPNRTFTETKSTMANARDSRPLVWKPTHRV